MMSQKPIPVLPFRSLELEIQPMDLSVWSDDLVAAPLLESFY